MKIIIDEEFTTIARLKDTKEKANTFAETFTDGDLIRMFNENFVSEWENHIFGEWYQITVHASCSSFLRPYDYQFHIEIYIFDKYSRFENCIYYIRMTDDNEIVIEENFFRNTYEKSLTKTNEGEENNG